MSMRTCGLQEQHNQRQAQEQPAPQQDQGKQQGQSEQQHCSAPDPDGKKFLPPGPNITSNAYFYTQDYEQKWLHTANLRRAARKGDISLNDVKAITFMVKNYLFGLYGNRDGVRCDLVRLEKALQFAQEKQSSDTPADMHCIEEILRKHKLVMRKTVSYTHLTLPTIA